MIKQPGIFKGLCKTQTIIFKRNNIILRCFFSLLLPNEAIIWEPIRAFLFPIHTGDDIKNQKDGDQNFTSFARYKMNYLNNSSVIIHLVGKGSQWIWRSKGTYEARESEYFLNQREEKNRSSLIGDALLVYCHNPEMPTVALHQRMAVWLCQCWWPGLLTALPVPHHCNCATSSIQTGLSSLPCIMLRHWLPSNSQHWHIWESLSLIGLGHDNTTIVGQCIGVWYDRNVIELLLRGNNWKNIMWDIRPFWIADLSYSITTGVS